uniref:Uncharacterized protein n=1 Tax=Lepidopteran phasma-related virus OKIAV246 TaxID=2746306 RepID=A0A7D7IUM9_9VIRU|nr:hypothetical protein [Lepidopteran phasma-related virus OKIAV246]
MLHKLTIQRVSADNNLSFYIELKSVRKIIASQQFSTLQLVEGSNSLLLFKNTISEFCVYYTFSNSSLTAKETIVENKFVLISELSVFINNLISLVDKNILLEKVANWSR